MKPIIKKIKDDKGGHYTIIDSSDKIEFVNPIEYYSNIFINMDLSVSKDIIDSANLPFPQEDIDKYLVKQAFINWIQKYSDTVQTEIPPNFISLLSTEKKKEQIKLLKEQSITSNQLLALIFKAWSEYGYAFSQYKVEYQHRGIQSGDLPAVVEVKDGYVNKVGSTKMTDGELKHAVKYRKAIISKFLDKGNEWHCFFITMKSLRGEENWKEGQVHYHYISDKFGHSRSKVIKELTNGNYKLGKTPHIELSEYQK